MSTALPPATDFTGSNITEAQFKTAITNLRDFLSGLFGTDGAAATALAALGAFAMGVVVKSTAYTVTAADRGKVLLCTGTWTLTLPPVATAGDGFVICVKNTGSGTITLDADASETIDGALTAALANTDSATMVLVCDGSAWHSIGKPAATPFGLAVLSTGSTIYKSYDAELYTGKNSYTTPAGAYGGYDYFPTQDAMSTTDTMGMMRMEHYGTVMASIHYKSVTVQGYARVLKNGSLVQEWSTASNGTYYQGTVNVNVAPGDVIEFQGRALTGAGSLYTKYRRVYVTQLTNP